MQKQNAFPLAFLLSSIVLMPTAAADEAQGTPVEGEESINEAECPVVDGEALIAGLDHLEREILLTRYNAAIEGLLALKSDLTCVQGPVDAQQLGRLHVNLGIARHRLGLVSEADEAFRQGAAIAPTLKWNEHFAASLGLKFYDEAVKVRESIKVQIAVTQLPEEGALYIDGELKAHGQTVFPVYGGLHFFQTLTPEGWNGAWIDCTSPIKVNLESLSRSHDSEHEAEAWVSEPLPRGTWVRRVGYGALGVSAGLYGASIVTVQTMAKHFNSMNPAPTTQAEYDAALQTYNDLVIPYRNYTIGLRGASAGMLAIGGAAWLTGTLMGRGAEGLSFSPVHLAYSGSF